MALRSIPSHPLLALRLGPTIGMPIALLYMALLLVRGAELSMARAEKVRFCRTLTSPSAAMLPAQGQHEAGGVCPGCCLSRASA